MSNCRVECDLDWVIKYMKEHESYNEIALEKIKGKMSQEHLLEYHRYIASNFMELGICRYITGEPISEVKNDFRCYAKFKYKHAYLKGTLNIDTCWAPMIYSVISGDFKLSKKIAKSIKKEGNGETSTSECMLYAIRDLILKRNRKVKEFARKHTDHGSYDILFYFSQICGSIAGRDSDVFSESMIKLLGYDSEEYNNLLKQIKHGRHCFPYPPNFSVNTVTLAKLAKRNSGLEIKVDQIPENLRQYLPMELIE